MNVHLLIRGRVQGVFYRQSARQEALALGVVGWVKNLPDGSVEAAVEGTPLAVNAFIAWCHRGPAAAHVEEVLVTQKADTGAFTDFQVVR